MARFPAGQDEIVALVEAMISGFGEHQEMFPLANPTALQPLLDTFKTARAAKEKAKAEARQTTRAKLAAFTKLVRVVRIQLKQAEIDAVDNPENLRLIGWGPRAPSTRRTVEQPEQPALAEGQPDLVEG